MVKISELTDVGTLTGAEQVPVNDGGNTKRTTVDEILGVQHDHIASDVTDLQALLDGKVDENASITPATKTKVTYDAKGLVTSGTDANVADISGLQTALDAKASLAGATFTGDIVVPAETYGSGWNGSNEAPTKNDIYDKVETITSGQWTRLTKSSTTQRTNTTTMASDPHLTFSMLANTKYMVRAFIIFEANAVSDIKIGYTGPSPTLGKIRLKYSAPTTPTVLTIATNDINTVTTITCTTGTYGFAEFSAVVHNGANSGTFAFQWAQKLSDANVTQVLAGSYIEYIVT